MGRVDQLFELIRCAISGIGCKQQNTVVAPITVTPEICDRHELDGSDAKFDKIRQALTDFSEAAHTTRVKLINHDFVPRAAIPVVVLPAEGAGVANQAGVRSEEHTSE